MKKEMKKNMRNERFLLISNEENLINNKKNKRKYN